MNRLPLASTATTYGADSGAVPAKVVMIGPALLTVKAKTPLTAAPVASCTVRWMLANVPAVDGAPVKTTLAPATVALRPAGRLDWATTVNGPVPPLTAMAPG